MSTEIAMQKYFEGQFFVMEHTEHGPKVKNYGTRPVRHKDVNPYKPEWRRPGPQAKPVSPELRAEIRRLYASGAKSDDIQKAVRIGWHRLLPVINQLRAEGVKGYATYAPDWKQEEIDLLRNLVARRKSWREISEALPGRSQSSCRNKYAAIKFKDKKGRSE